MGLFPSESIQHYWNYSPWQGFDSNYFMTTPAFQQLNSQIPVQESADIDLTDDVDMPSATVVKKSPTQARDFKLFCEDCGRKFTSKKRLENHSIRCLGKKIVSNPFPCNKCEKSFKKRSSMLKHSSLFHEDVGKSQSSSKGVKQQRQQVDSPRPPAQFHNVLWLAQSSCYNY